MYSYSSYGEDKAGVGSGSAGIILLFVFLLILFAVFRGTGFGHDGHHDGYGVGMRNYGYDGCCGGWGRSSIADFEAIAQNNQRVPVEQVQLAKDFGALKEKITMGNSELSRQISETAAAAELRACMEREADMRAQIAELKGEVMNQRTLGIVSEKFCKVDAILADINCNMARKVVAQPLAGLPELQCSNIPGRPFFGEGGCGCGNGFV